MKSPWIDSLICITKYQSVRYQMSNHELPGEKMLSCRKICDYSDQTTQFFFVYFCLMLFEKGSSL